jgi:hypothetical protein
VAAALSRASIPGVRNQVDLWRSLGVGADLTGRGNPNYDMQEDAMEWSLGKIIDEMNTRRGGTINAQPMQV